MNIAALLKSLGLDPAALKSGDLAVHSPIDGAEIARLKSHAPGQVKASIGRARPISRLHRALSARLLFTQRPDYESQVACGLLSWHPHNQSRFVPFVTSW